MIEFGPSDPSTIIECSANSTCIAVHAGLSAFIIFFILLTGFAYTTVLERRLIAWMQDRIGPNRAGPLGLLQPVADGIKLVFKQDVLPTGADHFVYRIAPLLKVVPTLIVLAVVPLGPPVIIPWFDGEWYRIQQGLVDVNVGVLWVLAITSISVYGITMAGWSSDNKYAMLGALRSSASMISYELSLSTTFVVPAMIAGSLSVGDIIEGQSGNFIFNWYIFQNPLAAAIMFVALLAEVNRAPFDLPEAEQELVAGHMTEYSGMKFAMFFMAEYISMIVISVIFSSMFLGGYHFMLVEEAPVLGPVWLTLKVVLLLSFMIWIRATLPRIRYDRLMSLGWKVMLPLSLLAVAWTAVSVVIAEETDNSVLYTAASIGLLIVIGAAALIFGREENTRTPANEGEVITLEKRGAGYLILQLVGSMISVPFMLFNYTIDTIKNVGSFVGTGVSSSEQEETPQPTTAPRLQAGTREK